MDFRQVGSALGRGGQGDRRRHDGGQEPRRSCRHRAGSQARRRGAAVPSRFQGAGVPPKTRALQLADVPAGQAGGGLGQAVGWPSIASSNWVYQYDHMVRAGTAINPGSDAAVIRVKADSYPPLPVGEPQDDIPDKYLAMSVDCNGVQVYLDPYEGSKATGGGGPKLSLLRCKAARGDGQFELW